MLRFRLFGTRKGLARRRARVESAVRDLEQAVREHLDVDLVVGAMVESARQSLGCRRVSAWLTTGADVPRLAAVAGERMATAAPSLVIGCAAQGRPQENQLTGSVALPMRASGSGLVGVLLLERTEWLAEERAAAAAVADRGALALHSAFLYEQAVAEREKSETILSRTGDAIVVSGAHGDIREWNPAAERTFGRAGQEAVGLGCRQVLDLHEGERALDCAGGCPLLPLTRDPASFLGVELWRPRPDGSRQPLLASAEAVRDPDGSVSDVVHSFRDVTRLKEADHAKTLFLATASHELKTPLTVIQGFASTLRSREVTPEVREMALEAMERRAIELNRIVDRLLLSSRIEAGHLELRIEDVDLRPILAERTSSLAAATGRAVSLDADADLPIVRADPSAVTTIVDHLLDNAIKYSPAGGVVRVVATGGETVNVRVADGGVGMDREQAAHCFDKFWQADSSDARRFGGTGIGLFIVRSLVEAMGGGVGVSSQLGRGSTFSFSLTPAQVRRPAREADLVGAGVGERSVIREFMRQIGVPVRREP